ncbi:Sugar fermentation stimulation protein [Alicyclobacillus macrosporangiidus]|uniref:Sugar fermentation stimulation protein n=1 Tax=Alicyclobacillus macrosporangiidus TaxID=392015 RepID=A0A1I7L6K9_9BACL|nr:Sugar fermentation stimulation protein [Alicyclobacillus macrosporangiidus]
MAAVPVGIAAELQIRTTMCDEVFRQDSYRRNEGSRVTYDGVVYGQWIERINRFMARVRLGGEELRVHVKSTGRLRELFVPGATVAMEPAKDGMRATRYSVIAVQAPSGWVNVDSQAPHRVAGDALGADRNT